MMRSIFIAFLLAPSFCPASQVSRVCIATLTNLSEIQGNSRLVLTAKHERFFSALAAKTADGKRILALGGYVATTREDLQHAIEEKYGELDSVYFDGEAVFHNPEPQRALGKVTVLGDTSGNGSAQQLFDDLKGFDPRLAADPIKRLRLPPNRHLHRKLDELQLDEPLKLAAKREAIVLRGVIDSGRQGASPEPSKEKIGWQTVVILRRYIEFLFNDDVGQQYDELHTMLAILKKLEVEKSISPEDANKLSAAAARLMTTRFPSHVILLELSVSSEESSH
jgi:hypothetical protein